MPITLGAALLGGLLGGGALSAGGSIAGGLLGQSGVSSGDQIIPSFDPRSSFPLAASQFESLAASGLANPDVFLNTGPLKDVFARIQEAPIDEKIKRRALLELQTRIDEGEPRQAGSFFGAPVYEGERYPRELEHTLARLNIGLDDLPNLIERQAEYDAAIAELGDVGPFQTDVIRNRLQANADIAEMAGTLLRGGDSPITRTMREALRRDYGRSIDDAEERILAQAQFGGFNPSSQLEQIAEMRGDVDVDTDLQALERTLLFASGISDLLNRGTAAAQGQAGLANQANLGALGIAANQAQAANALRQQAAINDSTSLANGVAGAFSSLGNTVGQLGVLGAFGGLGAPASSPTIPTPGTQSTSITGMGTTRFNPSAGTFAGGFL